MSTALDEKIDVSEKLDISDNGDHDMFAHYANKNEIMDSAMTGKPVIALCGKVWTPGRDPQKFKVCPECKEIYETLKN